MCSLNSFLLPVGDRNLEELSLTLICIIPEGSTERGTGTLMIEGEVGDEGVAPMGGSS